MIAYIDANRHRFGVEPICSVLPFAPRSYYAAKARRLSSRALRDAQLKPAVARVHRENFDRNRWDDYATAYEDAIRKTSTKWAPWYVVPADHNWVRNLAVGEILVDALERLDPQLPKPDPGLDRVEMS